MSDAHDKALSAWFTSGQGKSCANIHTLESARSQDDFQKYLISRLELAFAAGWDGCHAEVTALISDR